MVVKELNFSGPKSFIYHFKVLIASQFLDEDKVNSFIIGLFEVRDKILSSAIFIRVNIRFEISRVSKVHIN